MVNAEHALSPNTSSTIIGLYGMAARAVSQVWYGMDGQGIGVRGVLGLIPGGILLFQVSISNEIC